MNKEPIVLTSADPLPNELAKLKKLYWVFLILAALGIFWNGFLAIGLIGLVILYLVDYARTGFKHKQLRLIKFKYERALTQDELFSSLQQELISKYKGAMQVGRRDDDVISIEYDQHIYDLIFNDDGTFCIWWRKSLAGAFFSVSNYKSYKKIIIAMGIIGYAVQTCEKSEIS